MKQWVSPRDNPNLLVGTNIQTGWEVWIHVVLNSPRSRARATREITRQFLNPPSSSTKSSQLHRNPCNPFWKVRAGYVQKLHIRQNEGYYISFQVFIVFLYTQNKMWEEILYHTKNFEFDKCKKHLKYIHFRQRLYHTCIIPSLRCATYILS